MFDCRFGGTFFFSDVEIEPLDKNHVLSKLKYQLKQRCSFIYQIQDPTKPNAKLVSELQVLIKVWREQKQKLTHLHVVGAYCIFYCSCGNLLRNDVFAVNVLNSMRNACSKRKRDLKTFEQFCKICKL